MVQNGALAVLSLDGYKVQGMLPGMTAKGNEDVVPYFLRFSCCQQAVKTAMVHFVRTMAVRFIPVPRPASS